MRELFRKYREIILYVFFGGCTTLVNIVVYYAMTRFLGVGEYASNVTAWILSVLFAYVTNKIWVFESRSREAKVLLREMGSFFGCRLLSLGLDMGVLWLGIEILHERHAGEDPIQHSGHYCELYREQIFHFQEETAEAGNGEEIRI